VPYVSEIHAEAMQGATLIHDGCPLLGDRHRHAGHPDRLDGHGHPESKVLCCASSCDPHGAGRACSAQATAFLCNRPQASVRRSPFIHYQGRWLNLICHRTALISLMGIVRSLKSAVRYASSADA
jgi:hypothetical protein